MRWLCSILPWHKVVSLRHLSDQADWFKCSCGREYAINYSVSGVLPWSSVREFYIGHDYPPCTGGCCHPAHGVKPSVTVYRTKRGDDDWS